MISIDEFNENGQRFGQIIAKDFFEGTLGARYLNLKEREKKNDCGKEGMTSQLFHDTIEDIAAISDDFQRDRESLIIFGRPWKDITRF